MKVRVGNACWHAAHVQDSVVASEANFFAQEGIDGDVVTARIYPQGLNASRPGGGRYDESPYVLQDMTRHNIDIVTDVELATILLDHLEGRDELRIIGVWRNQETSAFVAAPGFNSMDKLKGKRIGVWVPGTEKSLWLEWTVRKAGLNPQSDVQWVVGYQYGSAREAANPLREGKTDAAIVSLDWVPALLEEGFHQLFNFLEGYPHGRPARLTVARQSFIDRNPEIIKRYWKAAIRAFQYMRIVPEHYPFLRYCEAKLRINNPDQHERMRQLKPMKMWEYYHGSMNGQPTIEGLEQHLDEVKGTGKLLPTVTLDDVQAVLRLEFVWEAWEELQPRDEIKRNLERLAPVIERYGF
ncbi:MAG: ABC transporter substrate-binding protein [Deltaproteobacteria bacterium]|nr:ABC transporter substrate-binding protein [Deltaproteobacteria bacterium]